jgi:EAL domain-containing protein (putative c-di-GMP-specific phosphodiesterase class I)
MLSPAHFIPLAEESGLIVPLGYWVLEQAIIDTAKLRERHPELRVSVNLSPRQLMDDRLVENVEALLRVHPVRRTNLVLELTESGILPNPDQASRILNSFRNLGVRVALDDFGTGQSSLSHLSQLQIDIVKIDRSFVSECWSLEARGAIVSAVLSICRARKLSVVAEGIETEAEEDFLLARDCVFGQGFRYHRPAAIEVVEQFIADRGAVTYQPEDCFPATSDVLH